MWIHEYQNWPNFTWNAEALVSKLADIRNRQGHLLGRMEGLGFELRQEASANWKRKTKENVKNNRFCVNGVMCWKMKSTIIGGLVLIPLTTMAGNNVEINRHRIKVVSVQEMNKDYPAEFQQKAMLERIEMKQQGYVKSDARDARILLSMRDGDMVAIQKKGIKDWSSPFDTHLKYNITDIKLAFNNKSLQIPEIQKVIGYAAAGMYIKDKGWTGIVSFYNIKGIGVCKLSLFNISLSNGGVKTSSDRVRYDVNNKVTSIYAHGNDKDGYMYLLGWDDETYIHDFECATKKFESDMINKMTPVAIKMDRQIDSLFV